MNSTKFKVVCQMMFGRSWQSQIADYLMVSRKTISSWNARDSIPIWVENEVKPLAARRAKESKFALESISMNGDDFYHNQAVLCGEVHHYDATRYTYEEIKQFIENQKWVVLELAKHQIREKCSIESVLQWAENYMLSDNDIASHLEQNDAALDDICEIQNMRGDAVLDVKYDIEIIYERFNK